MRYIYTGTGRGRAGGRRSFWAAWLVTSAGHAGSNDLGRSTRPFYFDPGARSEFLLLLVADIVVRAVGVIGEQIVDLVPRGIKLFAGATSFIGFRAHRVDVETERALHIRRFFAVFALRACVLVPLLVIVGALPHFCKLLELAQVPVAFRGDRVGQGYLAWGRLATVAFGGVRSTLGFDEVRVALGAGEVASGAGGTDRCRRRGRGVGGEPREAADGRRRDRGTGHRAGDNVSFTRAIRAPSGTLRINVR